MCRVNSLLSERTPSLTYTPALLAQAHLGRFNICSVVTLHNHDLRPGLAQELFGRRHREQGLSRACVVVDVDPFHWALRVNQRRHGLLLG